MSKKVLFMMVLFLVILSFMTSQVYAIDKIFDGIDNFESSAKSNSPIDQNELQKVSNTIYNIFEIIGVVIGVIVIVFLGIQFMTGSIETKAKIKESLIPLGIGLAVLFGAFTFWQIIVNLMQSAI